MEKYKHSNKFKVNSKQTRIEVSFLNLRMDWIQDYWEWKHAAISKWEEGEKTLSNLN